MLKPELLAAGFVCCVALVAPAAPFLLGPAHAQQAEAGLTQPLEASPATALADRLRMDETFAIMADEGRAHGAEIENGTFPGRGGAGWAATVDRIYDQGGMRVRFLAAFEAALRMIRPRQLTVARAGRKGTIPTKSSFSTSRRAPTT